MSIVKRIHCVADLEPDAYHAPGPHVYAINLGFECESNATTDAALEADESQAKGLFSLFLAKIKTLEFHVYSVDAATGTLAYLEAAPPLAGVTQAITGIPDEIIGWLDAQEHDKHFWTEPARDAAKPSDGAIDESAAGATHLLRGAQSWSAPVAHNYGLTRLIQVTSDPGAAKLLVLPVPPGTPVTNPVPVLTEDATPLWQVEFDLGGALGGVEGWTNELPATMADLSKMLTPEGYLLINEHAEGIRRVLDWFERGWSGPMSSLPSLLMPGTTSASDEALADLFAPIWTPGPNPGEWTLGREAATWQIMAALVSALDPLVVALTRPIASKGSGAEGEILGALITHLLDAFDGADAANTPRSAEAWRMILLRLLAKSPLLAGTASPEQLAAFYGITLDANPASPPGRRLLTMLMTGIVPASFTAADAADLAASVDGGNPIGFRADMYELVHEATRKLQDEESCEEAILKIMDSAASVAAAVTVPDAIVEVARPDFDLSAHRPRLFTAWRAFTSQLRDAFNGVDAVRRSGTADFLEALLNHHNLKMDPTEPPPVKLLGPAALVEHIVESDYFARRLLKQLGATRMAFDDIVDGLPLPPFPGDLATLTTAMTTAFADAVSPVKDLLGGDLRFFPDSVPHPLPIQVSSEFRASALDDFTKEFNGIAVALRRLDDTAVPPLDRWSHANLAELHWPNRRKLVDVIEDGAKAEPRKATSLQQWLPVAQDGRAPMFIDYQGFPFASKAIAEAKATADSAIGDELPRRFPFYEADVADCATGGFAKLPRLAYGRTFEAFSFATTNAGTLPLDLQQPTAPWLPRKDVQAPAVVFRTNYQRRTAIGSVAIVKKEKSPKEDAAGASKWVGAIADVRPLALDYARVAAVASADAPAVIDLLRDSDGHGMLTFPATESGRSQINVIDLTDLEWHGERAALTIEFRQATTDATGDVTFAPIDVDADVLAEAGRIRLRLETRFVEPTATEPARHDHVIGFEIGSAHHPEQVVYPLTKSSWWVRLSWASVGGTAIALSFADPHTSSEQDRRDTPLLLLAPPKKAKDKWTDAAPTTDAALIRAPRVGYLDFERWFANLSLFDETFPDEDAGNALTQLLLSAYAMRHFDQELAAMLDALPDPAVDALLVEVVCVDSLTGAVVSPKSATIPLANRLAHLADGAAPVPQHVPGLKKKLLELDKGFTIPVTLASADAGTVPTLTVKTSAVAPTDSSVDVTVPSGTVVELRVSPIVSAEHFEPQEPYPSVFHAGVRQLARRATAKTLIYPPGAIRIEAMIDALPNREASLGLTERMVWAQSAARTREYALVTAGAAKTKTDRNDWRLVSHIAVITQRWRPTGRPTYSYIKPADFLEVAANPEDQPRRLLRAAQAFRRDLRKTVDGKLQALIAFEDEVFFQRRDIDAETVTKVLLPLTAGGVPPGTPSPTIGTELQKFPWNAPSATYFRHRLRLRSRYAGALNAVESRQVDAWADKGTLNGDEVPADWNLRVAMLADGSRVNCTRPQMRALMPLTTAPDIETGPLATPPAIAILQEPPQPDGGLADRLGAELKVGFGFGFSMTEKEAAAAGTVAQVGILDARKEIGPDPRLSYSAMPEGQALAIGLLAEGPFGLTFDNVEVSAPAFPNSAVSLTPTLIDEDGSVSNGSGPSLEEHFLGVSLRRYLDPDWVVETRANLDGSDCLWIQLEWKDIAGDMDLLTYKVEDTEQPLIKLERRGGRAKIMVQTEEVHAGGSNAGQTSVAITSLPSSDCDLVILHAPVAPGRYSAAIFCVRANALSVSQGRSNQPLLLASVEWSPLKPKPLGKTTTVDRSEEIRDAVQVSLVVPKAATLRRTVASAPTFLAWTRTSRDFDRVSLVPLNRDKKLAGAMRQTDWQLLVASRSERGLAFRSPIRPLPEATAEKAAALSDLEDVWLLPSTWGTPYPIHVHRHLAVIGTRYATGMGHPIEVFSGAAFVGAATIDLRVQGEQLRGSSNLRLVEVETPASIISSGSPLATYNSAYFDLKATGGKWTKGQRQVRLFFRFVGSRDYIDTFGKLSITLDWPKDAKSEAPEAACVLEATEFKGACAAEVTLAATDEGLIVAWLVLVNWMGERTNVLRTSWTRPPDPMDDAGFIVRLTAEGKGEFWSDVSMLHSRRDGVPPEEKAAKATPEDLTPPGAGYFDFDWLFSATDGAPTADPALAVKSAALAGMVEAQARIVSVSPVIRVRESGQ